MSKYYSSTNYSGYSGLPKKNPKRFHWSLALKIICWTLGILIIVFVGFCWGINLYFTPERITKLIEEKGSEYLDAKITVGRADYTIFSTFPWLNFEIDSLSVVSKSLNELTPEERSKLPDDTEILAVVAKISGGVDVRKFMKGELFLRNLEISQPDLNLISVNDSVANYNIFPDMKIGKKMPRISLDKFNVVPPILVSYTSLPLSSQVKTEIDSLYIEHIDGLLYKFALKGQLEGNYKELALKGSTPFAIHSVAGVSYPELYVSLEDLSLKLENIDATIKTRLDVDTQKIRIEGLDANIKSDDVFKTIESLPDYIAGQIPLPKNLSGFLPCDIDLQLKSNWELPIDSLDDLSLADVPSFALNFVTNDANINYITPSGKKLKAEDIYVDAFLDYDRERKEETTLEIREFRVKGEGLRLDGDVSVADLLGETQIFNARMDYDYKMYGDLKGRVDLNGEAVGLGKEGVKNLDVKGNLATNSLKLPPEILNTAIDVANLKSSFSVYLPVYPTSNYHDSEIKLDLQAGKISVNPDASTDLNINRLAIKIDLTDTVPDGSEPGGNMILSIDNLAARSKTADFRGEGLHLAALGHLNSTPIATSPQFSLTSSADEKIIAERSPHTPFYLESQGGGMVGTIRSLLSLKGNVSLSKGDFTTPSYLYPVSITGMSLNTDLSNVEFSVGRAKIGDTGFSMAGIIEGIGNYFSSFSPVLLKANADISFTNVDINQLSWGYYGSLLKNGNDSALKMPGELILTASDSTAVLIPRNLVVNISLRSESAEYTGYRFSPLSAQILLKDGVADLRQLTIGTPYCTAIVDWKYSTRDLSDIFMDLKADVRNFSLEPFYGVFPQIITKAKELKDFTGRFDVNVDGSFGMFPDMFMNSPSLNMKFNVGGHDLQFSRHGKIERIIHLLMIKGDEPIRLSNLEISGGYHDNILQINPFDIRFDDYEIGVGGITNINGEMFYHIALEKSPFHVPFGVSIKGEMKHPEFRLGGTRIDDEKGEKISSDLSKNIDVNIMAWLKHGWEIFVKTAAKYEYEK